MDNVHRYLQFRVKSGNNSCYPCGRYSYLPNILCFIRSQGDISARRHIVVLQLVPRQEQAEAEPNERREEENTRGGHEHGDL